MQVGVQRIQSDQGVRALEFPEGQQFRDLEFKGSDPLIRPSRYQLSDTRAVKYRTGGCVRNSAVLKFELPFQLSSGSKPV